MSWRTIEISSSAKLDYQMGYMVVRQESTTKIHLSEIHTIILATTAISITCALLSELTKQKIKVVFCDEKRNPSSELMPYYGSHDSSAKVRTQIQWYDEMKLEVWTEIVKEKIRKQAQHLKSRSKPQYEMLENYVRQVQFADSTNREGHAAKVYFNALFGLDFSRGADIVINSALNYGYTIVASMFSREITSCGYMTQLGLFHDNMFNNFNLASDLMEPFRVLVDRKVCDMEIEEFTSKEKLKLVNLMQDNVMINGRNEVLTNAVRIYCKSIFDALEQQDIFLIRFYEDEF
jgi:CRISPR-associated endonuclease cas1, NMENI subtype